MFGMALSDGFDLVIQNPPYISHEKLSAETKAAVASYDCWEPFADIYCYFIERAMQLIRNGGISCSIEIRISPPLAASTCIFTGLL